MPLTDTLLALVMCSSQLMGFGRGPVNPLAVAIAVVLAVWVLHLLARPAAPVRSPGFVALVGLFLGTVVLSGIGEVAGALMSGLLGTSLKLLLAMLLVQVVDDERKLRRAVGWFLAASAIAGLAGILQVYAFHWWNVEYSVGEPSFTHFQTVAGAGLRATGFSRWPDQFAEPLCIAATLALYLAGSARRHGRRLLMLAVSALTLYGIWLARSRSSWIAVVAALLAFPFVAQPSRARRWLALEAAAAVVLLYSGGFHWLNDQLHDLGEQGIHDRAMLIRAGMQVLGSHPWNGVGIFNFGDYSPSPERYPVHNAFLQVATELGLPGLVALLGVAGWVSARLWLAIRLEPQARIRTELKAVLIGLIALLVMMQSGPLGFNQFAWIYFALAEAAAAATLRREGRESIMATRRWIYEYAGIVWRGRWAVGLTTAVAVVTALGMSARLRPSYESLAEFYVTESLPPVGRYTGNEIPLLAVLQNVLLPTIGGEREIMFTGLLESQAVQNRVHEAVPEKPQGEYGRDVDIYPMRTHMLRVRVQDHDAELAARVANAYPKALESFFADVAAPHEQQGLEAAKDAAARALEGLVSARAELQAFLEGARTADLGASISESVARKSGLERDLEQARIALQSVENRIVAAEDRLRRESNLLVSSSQATQSQAARQLMSEIAKLQEQLVSGRVRGADGKQEEALQARLQERKRSLGAEMEKLVTQTQKRFERRSDSLDELLRRQVVSGYVDRAALEAEIAAKTQALSALASRADNLPSQRVREEFLRTEVDRFQRMVDTSAISYEEAKSQVGAHESNIVVVREGEPASTPLFPLPWPIGLAAAVIGLIAGIYLAFALEYVERIREARVTA